MTDGTLEDVCGGCGSPWNARYAAFECGYPLSDGCYAGEMEDARYEAEEIAAWEALVDEAFGPGRVRRMTQEEALILDGWEFEVFGEEPFPTDPKVAAEVAAELDDGIPF